MSSGITIKFKRIKDKREFLSLFDKFEKRSGYYLTFKFDIEVDGVEDMAVSYLNFNIDDNHSKKSINFEYGYGDCHDAFCYYLAYEVSKKYDIKITWDSLWEFTTKEDFFKNYGKNPISSSAEFWNLDVKDEKENIIPIIDKSILSRIKVLNETEKKLRDKVCPGFFEDNKFEKYLWKK